MRFELSHEEPGAMGSFRNSQSRSSPAATDLTHLTNHSFNAPPWLRLVKTVQPAAARPFAPIFGIRPSDFFRSSGIRFSDFHPWVRFVIFHYLCSACVHRWPVSFCPHPIGWVRFAISVFCFHLSAFEM